MALGDGSGLMLNSCLVERDRPVRGSLRSSRRRGHQTARELFSEDPAEDTEGSDAGLDESEAPEVRAPVRSPTIGQMGAPLLPPSSSLLSKRQREAMAESPRSEAAKKVRRDEMAETVRTTEGQDDVPPVSIPGAAPSGSGAALPAFSAASGAVLATTRDASPQSGERPPTGAPAASVSASGGAIEKVISIPSDEEEEAGNEEEPPSPVDPNREVAGEEGAHSWANRSSEEDDNVSVHEALSSEEDDLALEDASGQIGGSPAPAKASSGGRSSARGSPLQREAPTLQMTISSSAAAVDVVTTAPRASLVAPAPVVPVTTPTVTVTEFREVLEHDASFLRKRLGATAARPYFQHLSEVEGAVRQLLALRAESSTLVDLASREVRVAMADRDRRLNENMTLELKLSAESEQVKAEDARVARDEETVDSQFSRLSFEVERLKQVVAEAQAALAIQEKARAHVAKELEAVKSRRRLTTDSVKEKDRALKNVRETIQDLVSCTEEDIRREVLRRLELRHAEEIREAELRLKSL
ncbi:uncharacterized protein LOC109842016 [Asparagus officinalis]|uniref:uncharacterized protein LOC109842016 n=1 Tax=Asparagus officinalis TaxID=4686 RepID=UPI00098E008A|nr:uncharacterized protein LOC109842016 [Asparagus officinalis]